MMSFRLLGIGVAVTTVYIVAARLGFQFAFVVAVISWFIALFTGRVPEGLRNFAALALRFETQTYGYALLLTPRYPSFDVTVES